MKEGIESIGNFVVSVSDTAELLEPVEKVFDETARLVAMPVNWPLFSVTTGWDSGQGSSCLGGATNLSLS